MTEACSIPLWVWGRTRFWLDDSLNGLVAVSERYVAAQGVGHVYVWGRPDGVLIHRFTPQAREVDAWFDDDAGCLLLRTGDGRVEVVDLRTHAADVRDGASGDPVFPAVIEDRSGTGAVTITWPDGQELVRHYPHELVLKVASAPAAGLVAVPHGLRAVDVLDRTGEVRQIFRGFERVALTPDGRTVALAASWRRSLVFGDVATGAIDDPDEPPGDIRELRFSGDSARLLVVAAHRAWLLDPEAGRPIVRLEPCPSPRLLNDDAVSEARFSADGRYVIANARHQIVRWSVSTGAVVQRIVFEPRLGIESFSVDRQGVRVLSHGSMYPGGLMAVGEKQASVWDLERGDLLASIELDSPHPDAMTISPDGRRVAIVDDDEVAIYELPDPPGEPVALVERLSAADWPGFVTDGLVVRHHQGRGLSFRRVSGGAIADEYVFPTGRVFSTCLDGHVFAVGDNDGKIVVIEGAGRELAVLRVPCRLNAVVLAPDGSKLVAGGHDGVVRCFALPSLPTSLGCGTQAEAWATAESLGRRGKPG